MDEQYCGIKLGDQLFAINVVSIQEIIRHLPITPIPLAKEGITGLINLRGQIVTCISLKNILNSGELTGEEMNIIVKNNESSFSLLVDEVTDIFDVSLKDVEGIPSTVNENLQKFSSGVYKSKDGLAVLLDEKKIIESFKERSEEDSSQAA